MTLKTLVRILILILCVIVLMRPETAEPRRPPIAHIPDANLRAAINTALNDWYLERLEDSGHDGNPSNLPALPSVLKT